MANINITIDDDDGGDDTGGVEGEKGGNWRVEVGTGRMVGENGGGTGRVKVCVRVTVVLSC